MKKLKHKYRTRIRKYFKYSRRENESKYCIDRKTF